MRKALQAEQSKAEKLLQLASLEKRCMEKENEINELRRRIIDKLEEEQQEKEEKEQEHERDTAARQQKNTIDLKALAGTLTDLNRADDDWTVSNISLFSQEYKLTLFLFLSIFERFPSLNICVFLFLLTTNSSIVHLSSTQTMFVLNMETNLNK